MDDDGYALAIGFGGQYIIVAPERDLVVTFTSGLPLVLVSRPIALLESYVLPAIVSDDALPANPDAQARLAEVVVAAEAAPEPTPFDLPATAVAVDGVHHEFQPNDAGYQSFAIGFDEQSASLRLDVDWAVNQFRFHDSGDPTIIEIGLEGRFLTTEVWGQRIAARGTWTGDDTFTVESQIIGHVDRVSYEFDFGDGLASLVVRNMTDGSTLQLSADPAE